MSDRVCRSDTISPRRALLEEVLEERSKAVAGLPVEEQDPDPRSALWPLGAARLAGRARMSWGRQRRRRAAVELAVLALAWIEAIDAQLPADAGAGGDDDVAG